MSKPIINLYWFKRDLRLLDNVPLQKSLDDKYPTLLFYLFEPILKKEKHYSKRHWTFVKESLADLNNNLKKYNTMVHVYELDAIIFFRKILDKYNINKVYSHQETGIDITFKRDLEVKKFCKKNKIQWIEEVRNGVFRGRKNRTNWKKTGTIT